MKIIINADDCGRSIRDNELIGKFMESHLITSTTVMATGADLEGVKKLYDQFKSFISFGVHLNVTSGRPLKYSQILDDYGFYIIDNQGINWGGE